MCSMSIGLNIGLMSFSKEIGICFSFSGAFRRTHGTPVRLELYSLSVGIDGMIPAAHIVSTEVMSRSIAEARVPSMKQDTANKNIIVMAISVLLLSLLACGKKEPAPAVQPASEPAAQSAASQPATQPAAPQSLSEISEPQRALVLPVAVARRTGDLDEILKARNIRALVVNSH